MPEEPSAWRGRIPADIDRPEPLLFNLTARQCLIIAPALAGGWVAYLLLREVIPLWILALVLAPLLGAVIAIALAERDGRGLEKVLASAWAWKRAPKHLVPAPSGELPALPRWAPQFRQPKLAPLRLPASAITPSGVIDLGGRCAVIVACTTIPFQLASGREQDQTVAAFAGVLDSLTEPAQILVQRRRADLSGLVAMVRTNADHLPHPALTGAATAHADFLEEITATHELSHQQVLVVVTTTGPARSTGGALRRCAEEVADRLAALGVRTQVLDGEAAEQVLRASMTAPGTHLTDTDPHETDFDSVITDQTEA